VKQSDRELVIARAEVDFLRRRPSTAIGNVTVQDVEVRVFDHSRRVMAKYGFEITTNRVRVWRLS
jgi:hypothetical protein